MPLPGAEVNLLDTVPPSGTPVDTGLTFAVGETERGPLEPTEIRSYGDLERLYGARQPWGVLHDTLEVAFRTGLSRAIVTRVVADTAVTATVDLDDGSADATITLSAPTPGAWANGATGGLSAQVINNTTTATIVLLLDGVEIERSPDTDRNGLLAWEPSSGVVVADGGASTDLPASGTVQFASGDDARVTIDQADYQAALDLITPEHGTGQLIAPGAAGHTDEATIHLAMLAKAADPACQRFAVLDIDPAAAAGTAVSKATPLRASGNGRWGTIVHPRVQVRAQGSTRLVPASGFWVGRAAATDALAGVGQAPAGQLYGEHGAIVDVERTFTDAERLQLNDAGVIPVVRVNGNPRVYGAVTLADPAVAGDIAYRWVTASRAIIRIRALAQQVVERYVLRRIDGPRLILAELSNDLSGLLDSEFQAGNLFGDRPQDAYRVDTSYPTVNTDQSLADGYLRAAVEVRVVPVAERVVLDIAVRAPGDQINN